MEIRLFKNILTEAKANYKESAAYILGNGLIAELEVEAKQLFGTGSRAVCYDAMKVTEWNKASLTQKYLLFVAWMMMVQAGKEATGHAADMVPAQM